MENAWDNAKRRMQNSRVELCVCRAELMTEFMQANPRADLHPSISRAKALCYVLQHMPIRLRPEEIIVGDVTTKVIGAPCYPEFSGSAMWSLVDPESRDARPLHAGEKERRIVEEKIIPFWEGKDMLSWFSSSEGSRKWMEAMKRGIFIPTNIGGLSHCIPDYGRILNHGLAGILREAEELLKEANHSVGFEDNRRRIPLLESLLIAGEGVCAFAKRHELAAREKLGQEMDPYRRRQFELIVSTCARVPKWPARGFLEALQSIWFIHLVISLENVCQGLSLGRLDQLLYPFYLKDKEKGALTEQQALSLLRTLWSKLSSLRFVGMEGSSLIYAGGSPNQVVTIGGANDQGIDETNELSILILRSIEGSGLMQPNLAIRLHSDTSSEFKKEVARVVEASGVSAGLFNDEVVIDSLLYAGVREDDAPRYAIVGCVEPVIPGKTFAATASGFINLAKCLEEALGYSSIMASSAERESLPPWRDMEGLVKAFGDRVHEAVSSAVQCINMVDRYIGERLPSPLISLLTEGCLGSGRDVTQGGAIYDFSGLQAVGLADVADSMAALDLLVFREKRLSWTDIQRALQEDFKGHQELYHRLRTSAPKYGNGNPLADRYARIAVEIFCEEVSGFRNERRGAFRPGIYSLNAHVGMGRAMGALPSGRRSGEPLANGICPANGLDRNGPTAVLASSASIGASRVTNGVSLTQNLDPALFSSNNGKDILLSLVEGYFSLCGMHIQFNLIDRQILLDAVSHPERYAGLLVRVAGYSAYFVELPPELQQEIIERTVHRPRG